MDKQLNMAPCGYFVMKPDGYIIEVNQTFCYMLGASRSQELTGRHIHSILTVASKLYYQTFFTPIMASYKHVNEMYLTFKLQNGDIPVLLNAVEREGRFECVIVHMTLRHEYENDLLQARRNAERMLQETSQAYENLQHLLSEYEEKKQEMLVLNAALQEMTVTDPLTGLKNRRYFQEQLTRYVNQSKKDGTPFSILLIDIDHFKKVNDTFGHPVGDAVLQELAGKLQSETREEDVTARMGGEEFTILLSQMGAEQAQTAAEHIRFNIENGKWFHTPITVSIGVASFRQSDTISSLMSRSDEALYQAKKEGRNRIALK
ncbi:sensor domain-containing diguanylate cyclase [Domibacillus enclensis]|uniref:GGDEF domain-containing protein n=1 Tax=Domibacillus enclensis TaxID=1017273 RepID=A0A1N6TNS5_9BACI|nr:sensor domain-containing diguanylate cyclase [Domibacillus enclensis]OXS78323.1 GGDEF domain-containing protein [Domibacillus enclensis]SIQ55060.1 sigma-B regulation protein RsbU (phosphoserine phosphatase) [Domibacillus enclensis]